jgi:hypothetical protein
MREVHSVYPFVIVRRIPVHQALVLFSSLLYLSRVKDCRDLALLQNTSFIPTPISLHVFYYYEE